MDFTDFFDYAAPDSSAAPRQEIMFLPAASKPDWDKILSFCTRMPFHAGATVIAKGDRSQALYIVALGELEVVHSGRNAREVRQLAAIPQGSVFGEQAFFDGEPRSASVRAVTDGELLELTLAKFDVLAGQEPHLARQVLFDLARILSLRLRQTTALALAGR